MSSRIYVNLRDLQRATVLHTEGSLHEAEQLYLKVLASDPDNTGANHQLGVLYHQTNRAESAYEHVTKALARDDKQASFHNTLGMVLCQLGRLDEAVEAYQRALDLAPELGQVHFALGNVLMKLGHDQAAIDAFEEARRLDPKLSAAHSNLGIVHRNRGRLDAAVQCFQDASSADPTNAHAHYNLGNAYREKGDLAQAAAAYKATIELAPKYEHAYLNLGLVYQAQGQLDGAEAAFRDAIGIVPSYAEAHNNLGSVLLARSRLDQAWSCFEEAIRISPAYAEAHSNEGDLLRRAGEPARSIAACERALAINPELAEAHSNLGNALVDLGRYEEARDSYEKAARSKPNDADLHNNLGLALDRLDDHEAAIAAYTESLRINPSHVDAYNNLGAALARVDRLEEAAEAYRKGLHIDPENVLLCNNLGLVLQTLGKASEAVRVHEEAIRLDPENSALLINVGRALHVLGREQEAIERYERALELEPGSVEAHNNLGASFSELGDTEAAIAHYEEAARLDPEFVASHYNLALLHQQLAQADKAIGALETVLRLAPGYADAQGFLLQQLHYICDWKRADEVEAELDRQLESPDHEVDFDESPFVSISRSANPERNFAVARNRSREIAQRVAGTTTSFSFDDRKAEGGKIRLGYLSNDLHDHATGYLVRGLLASHDRDRFEVYAYSYGPEDGSVQRERIREACDELIDIERLDFTSAAQRIFEDRVDILVDLKGHTFKSRLEICALGPAPIQATYLGYPGTSGADFFDYLIADKMVVSERARPFYSEKIVYLPHCYQANDRDQSVSVDKPLRRDFGLPAEGVVLASFNQPYKLDRTLFSSWMRILDALPKSVLWLLKRTGAARDNLWREAAKAGIDPTRLVFSEFLPNDEHLARLALADLVLDTLSVNGHTTTRDSLYVGVPVVTVRGEHFASRVSASILQAAGLPELVTTNLTEYERLAIELGNDGKQLAALAAKVSANKETHPLFDTKRFTGNFERGLELMWQRWTKGEPPRDLEIADASPVGGETS